MGYLRQNDYILLVQPTILNQYTRGNATVQPMSELLAQEEIYSKLKQRYSLEYEFTPTLPYSFTSTYIPQGRCEINFPAYVPATAYNADALVVNAGVGYICTGSTTGVFDPAKWTAIGNQYDIYNAVYPHPLFLFNGLYNIGDQVYWKGNTYTCKIQTQIPYHTLDIQANSYGDLPLLNIYPDDPINGLAFWGSPTVYVVPAGTLPTDTTFWTLGDNRSQQVVQYMVMMVLYYMNRATAPNNIEKVRIEDYNRAMQYFHDIAHGEANANLLELKPDSEIPMKWGSQVKRNNQW
jgi:hypothetical protein